LEEITSTYDDLGMRCERDAFDTLFDHAPDKLQVVKKVCLSYTSYYFIDITVNGLSDG
jgi:parvin